MQKIPFDVFFNTKATADLAMELVNSVAGFDEINMEVCSFQLNPVYLVKFSNPLTDSEKLKQLDIEQLRLLKIFISDMRPEQIAAVQK
jgi:hypothetical protein